MKMPNLFNSLSIVCLFALTAVQLAAQKQSSQQQQQQPPPQRIPAATSTTATASGIVTTATITATSTAAYGASNTNIYGNVGMTPGMHINDAVAPAAAATTGQQTRNGYAQITALEKEVVERLIKQWAPVVWLAPEEKFLPLGVEEFLNHVHPMDKDSKLMSDMPFNEYSTKTFLVTNSEVDELLKNENSFLFGRNPTASPVPIYAVVNLCQPPKRTLDEEHQQQQQRETTHQPTAPMLPLQQLSSTRGPYIPVSIDPLDAQNDTIRRSSRLYPVFQRVKREAGVVASSLAGEVTDGNVVSTPNLSSLPYMPQFTPPPLLPLMRADFELPVPADISEKHELAAAMDSSIAGSSFIANLADNVKFSADVLDDEELQTNNVNVNDQNAAASSSSSSSSTMSFSNEIKHGSSKLPGFHVTYWMFYPYSQGKTICTLSLGPLGRIPFPAVYGYCLGRRKDIGSHIGDWEHMSLYFNGDAEPEAMYVSAHDAGAYYSYNRLTGSFEFKRQETRKGILQRPNFPKTVTTFNDHPVLFAAKGSHGLWTAPGKHRFIKVARFYDINGFGTPWNTWKSVDISYENLKSYGRALVPNWLTFKGKWGNPKSRCHPFGRIGLNFCEFIDGPTGIPLKEPHFECGATYR